LAKKKKSKKKKSVLGIYLAMLIWVICSQTLPMYTMSGILGTAVITLVGASVLGRLFGGKRRDEADDEEESYTPYTRQAAPRESESATSYGPEIDSIIADGNRAMSEMGRLYASIDHPDVKKKINELMRVSDKIVQDAIHDPSDVPQIRKFLDYYLPTTIKLLNAYDRMDDQGIEGENIDKTKASILEMLDTAIDAFKKQLDSLFANQALDIETDIDVMNTMLKREGLAGGSAYDFKLH